LRFLSEAIAGQEGRDAPSKKDQLPRKRRRGGLSKGGESSLFWEKRGRAITEGAKDREEGSL